MLRKPVLILLSERSTSPSLSFGSNNTSPSEDQKPLCSGIGTQNSCVDAAACLVLGFGSSFGCRSSSATIQVAYGWFVGKSRGIQSLYAVIIPYSLLAPGKFRAWVSILIHGQAGRTPKVCRIMALWARFMGFGPLFYLLWGLKPQAPSSNSLRSTGTPSPLGRVWGLPIAGQWDLEHAIWHPVVRGNKPKPEIITLKVTLTLGCQYYDPVLGSRIRSLR